MRTETHADGSWSQYLTLDEIATTAESHWDKCEVTKGRGYGKDFTGLRSNRDALTMAREGWEEQLPAALTAADACVTELREDNVIQAFVPTFDVSGADVDMGRYLAGEPECMVDYPLTEIVKAGRVITLCAGVSFSAGISTESIIRRGQVVVALAMALSALGYATEIWADGTYSANYDYGKSTGTGRFVRNRVLVKSATDVLDPARVMFALAHPAFNRVLGFAAAHEAPKGLQREVGIGGNYGYPTKPVQDLADGTIYLDSRLSDRDETNMHDEIMAHLRDLGITE